MGQSSGEIVGEKRMSGETLREKKTLGEEWGSHVERLK